MSGTPLQHVHHRGARRVVRAASRLVPKTMREEWLERWEAELLALEETPESERPAVSTLGLAAAAWPDAIVECLDAWRDGWSLRGLASDVRLAVRHVRRAPVSALATVLITALGAAAATALFGLIDAVLVRTPPGLAAPHELLLVGRGDERDFDTFSFPNYRDLRDGLADAVHLAAFGNATAVVGAGADARAVPVQFVSANYFAVAGAAVGSGPGLSADDAQGAPGAVLSDWFARAHPDAVASLTLVVDGRAVPVVGIAAEGFVGTTPGNAAPAMWLPLALAERSSRRLDERGWSWLWLFGRRQPGVSFPGARAAIQTVHARLAESNRGSLDDSVTVVEGVGLRPPDRREAIRISSMLMAAALVVWLVAAANAAGLHLSRALGAARDTAVRLAIGAPRARVIRGFLVEHTLLAAGGGAAAWIVARPVARAIESALPYDLALSFDPDARGLVFAVAATATVSLLVAVRPFWTAVAPDLVESLKQAREPGGARSRAAVVLVAAQVALSAGLLISTGLLAKSLRAAAATHPGFDASGVVMASFRRQPQGREPALLREEIVRRALGVAGATGAGLATSLPLVSPQSTRSVFGPGAAYDPDASAVDVIASHVDRGFFETLRIPLVEGRWPSMADWSDGSTPVVVSAPAARRLWPEAGPDRRADSGPLLLVATAVTGDLRARSIRESSQPVMFLPLEAGDQMPSWLVLRTTAPPRDAIAGLRAALDPLRSDLVVGRIEMMAPAVAASMADTRIAADVAVPLALLSVLFSAAGLYGVASRRVLDRRRELGVRLALGASAARLCAGVVRDTLLWAAVGLTAGVALGVALGGLMRSLLFGVRAADPAVIAAAMSIVAATAAAAALLPAWRAAHIDPQTALRID